LGSEANDIGAAKWFDNVAVLRNLGMRLLNQVMYAICLGRFAVIERTL
jgi:hypothetical protein